MSTLQVHYYVRRLYHRTRKFRRIRRARALVEREQRLQRELATRPGDTVVKEVLVHAAVNEEGDKYRRNK